MEKYLNNNISALVPSQPGLILGKAYYIQKQKECNQVTKTDAVFYQFRLDKQTSTEVQMVPDACMDILFCLDPKKPRATFYGKRLESKKITLEPGFEYFGFRPYSERGIKKLNKKIIDLCGNEAPLNEVINSSDIVEKIYLGKSFEDRINIFDEFAQKYIIDNEKITDFTNYVYRAICYSRGNISMDEITDYTGYSERYVRKKFKEFYGIAPKRFSRIIRFQNSLQMLLNFNNCEFSDVVYDSGFYDQAHFIREFKNFSGTTPSNFVDKFAKSCV